MERALPRVVVFYFNNKPITWLSQKQPTVALSSCEAEFMAATSAACQAIWLRGLLAEVTGREEEQVVSERSKHINTRFHYIRECVENELIRVEHISGEEQRADILTKALPKLKFAKCENCLGWKGLKNQNLRKQSWAQDWGGDC
ncbi:hypothetical protein E3N88_45790 [Mikania micrantha]|uniref:Reverse transcriptase Ty1/copia-type domain-containing protein n=1 Tax=Mikania micrantha TaxID=192012 RepID=A0A5N6L836_9ASTR|nr:hypothetical protein E3N88_45790 [Mikania micrantha]